jgi:hypothetical protein
VTLACREGHLSYEERWSVWSVDVSETARVYEVSCLEDWVSLAEEYKALVPSESRQDWSRWTEYSGEWAMPAWAEVMNSWDGVHISLLGYLSAAYRKVEVDGSAIYLAGWNPDETAWFSKVRLGEFVGSFASLLAWEPLVATRTQAVSRRSTGLGQIGKRLRLLTPAGPPCPLADYRLLALGDDEQQAPSTAGHLSPGRRPCR